LIIESEFKPAWWLPDPHLQTMWAGKFRRIPSVKLQRHRIELGDGDFLDLDWGEPQAGPLVVLLHGLGGCSQSLYVLGMLHALRTAGFNTVVMNFRGCSGEPNRLDRSYHAGETDDVQFVIDHLLAQSPTTVAVIGFSLGGNILLKWLGEISDSSPLTCAVAISVPFNLFRCATRLDHWSSIFYRRYLLRRVEQSVKSKVHRNEFPLDKNVLESARTFWEFDDKVTAPLHGFKDVQDYYMKCSSKHFLKAITTPTLIIQAKDDPFMYPDVIPNETELSSAITLEISECGGHVGFIQGSVPFKAEYYLEVRVTDWLSDKLMRSC